MRFALVLITLAACTRTPSPQASSRESFSFAYGVGNRDGAFTLKGQGTEKPWQWASVTKQFVAVLVMQDVQAGRLTLNDTVEDRLPDFSGEGREAVTIEQLLRHTSGLGVPDSLPESMDTDPVAFCRLPMREAPGTSFEYNNCDTAIAAAILERVNGVSWARLLRARILEPLKMRDSGVLTAPVTDGSVITSGTPHLYGASAAMYGTLKDLLRFNAGLMSGELLDPESLEQLWSGDPKLGFVALGAWEYEAQLRGCKRRVRLVERRGDVGDIQVVSVIAPKLGTSMAAFIREPEAEFGEIWTQRGLVFELASEVFCSAKGAVSVVTSMTGRSSH